MWLNFDHIFGIFAGYRLQNIVRCQKDFAKAALAYKKNMDVQLDWSHIRPKESTELRGNLPMGLPHRHFLPHKSVSTTPSTVSVVNTNDSSFSSGVANVSL